MVDGNFDNTVISSETFDVSEIDDAGLTEDMISNKGININQRAKDPNWLYCGDTEWCYTTRQECNLNEDGTGYCTCMSGYTDNDNFCADNMNECEQLAPYPCFSGTGGACVDQTISDGEYECVCHVGYVGMNSEGHGPTMCIREGSCFLDPSICDASADCVLSEIDQQHYCTCKIGYHGDGLFCSGTAPSSSPSLVPSKEDKCANCDPIRETCTDDERCVCKTGFFSPSGYGGFCQDHNECEKNTHDCDANAKCSNIDGSYQCFCKSPFEGNGKTCSVKCNSSNPNDDSCGANASCVNDTCECDEGFGGDGFVCTTVVAEDVVLTLDMEPMDSATVRVFQTTIEDFIKSSSNDLVFVKVKVASQTPPYTASRRLRNLGTSETIVCTVISETTNSAARNPGAMAIADNGDALVKKLKRAGVNASGANVVPNTAAPTPRPTRRPTIAAPRPVPTSPVSPFTPVDSPVEAPTSTTTPEPTRPPTPAPTIDSPVEAPTSTTTPEPTRAPTPAPITDPNSPTSLFEPAASPVDVPTDSSKVKSRGKLYFLDDLDKEIAEEDYERDYEEQN